MDEMRISSEFMQGLLAKIVRKIVTKKLGIGLDLMFDDPIGIMFDGEEATLSLNLTATLSKEDLMKLLKDLV